MAPQMMAQTAAVALGGAAGALCRYALQQCAATGSGRLLITIGINLLGCLAIGIACTIAGNCNIPAWLNRMIVAGFLGGFTTFSAFALDTMEMLQTGKHLQAAVYVGISVAGGIVLCGLGMKLTEKLMA